MFRLLPNYLLSFLRQASRNKVFTILNLLGLSVGMAAFLLLLQFVTYERSFACAAAVPGLQILGRGH